MIHDSLEKYPRRQDGGKKRKGKTMRKMGTGSREQEEDRWTGQRIAGSSGKQGLTEIRWTGENRMCQTHISSVNVTCTRLLKTTFDGTTPIKYHGTGLLSRARTMELSRDRMTSQRYDLATTMSNVQSTTNQHACEDVAHFVAFLISNLFFATIYY